MALPGVSDTLSIIYDNWIIFLFLDMDRRSFSSYWSLPLLSLKFWTHWKICSIIWWVNELQSQMASGDFIHAAIHLFRNEEKKKTPVLWGYYRRQQIRRCNAALHSGFCPFPRLLWLGICYSWVWNFVSGKSNSTMKMIECTGLQHLEVTIYFYSPKWNYCVLSQRDAQELQPSAGQ